MADNAAVGGDGGAGDGSSSGGAGGERYFCYQCEKEVAVAGPMDAMTCAECEGGFVEVLAAAAPEFRRQRRRRRRAHDGGDAMESMSQQMLQMVQVLLEASRTNNRLPGGAGDAGGGGELENGGPSPADTLVEDGEVLAGRSGEEAAGNGNGVVIVRERHLGQDDNSEEHESDSEAGGLRLELEGFDLNEDDDEWEEAEEEEGGGAAAATTTTTNLARYETNAGGGEEHDHDHDHDHDHHGGGDRDERLHRARNHLAFYMREFFQNLLDQNLEVRLELPDMYLGNPGDYLDSRGFEQLLQQLAENDNTRRGAPPAAKAAVDLLEMVKIEQQHIDSGIAVCAICKEQLLLDEPAKQLPCLHLYHQDCILPWLSSRNSCPVCRYELPTDDPDYEEQKKGRRAQGSSSPGATTTAAGATTTSSGATTTDSGATTTRSGGTTTSPGDTATSSGATTTGGDEVTNNGDGGRSSGVGSEEFCDGCHDHDYDDDHDGEGSCQDEDHDQGDEIGHDNVEEIFQDEVEEVVQDGVEEVVQDGVEEICQDNVEAEEIGREESEIGRQDDDGEVRQEKSEEESGGEAAAASGGGGGAGGGGWGISARSWLILAVGPVLSVMGFVIISLANHLAAGKPDRLLQSNDVPGTAQRHWWFH